ncbi:DUF4238 domain-containing protein [uncultured Sulfitobacter sp.]|uniref:DUF4238 domain-containing protein n=1 Tax=uncultured Sulfitobacter sp. TaxID=191468 RepID=UPI000C89F8C7|nr:DUF4238 domain-containing protein [uncultured Sulfitobacter sp.]MAO01034.1 hypothetical protein [Roseovarius sp.]|tara:strand:+ start:370 stop:1287 length:918 start_codon:yes stop_codon:yes gene_type:complete
MSSGSKPTRRCHWVPQAYLKAFAADNRKPPRIWRLSNQESDAELKRIDRVAVRNHLYVVRDKEGQRDDAQEKRFAELEQFFSSKPWKALQTGFVDLSDQSIRKMVALLAATMYVRNPAHFELSTRIHQSFVDTFSGPWGLPDAVIIGGRRVALDHSSWPEHANASEDDLKRNWFDMMNSCGDIAKMFLGMRWAMVASEEPVFITSDHPITFLHPDLRFRGIKNPDTSVIFPISPTRVLCMDHRHEEPANEYYPAQHHGAAINMLVWRDALEFMFSPREPHEVCRQILELEEHIAVGEDPTKGIEI